MTAIKQNVWAAVQQALHADRSIKISYQAPGYDTAVTRVLDPYHLVGHDGEWYLLAYSHHNDEVRVYAMSRIKKCSVTRDAFSRPSDFAPENYIDPNMGVFVNEPKSQVAIGFSSDVAPLIRERTWHPDQSIEALKDGRIVLRFTTNQLSQSLFWISQWGPNAEVLEPPELRKMATEWFREASSRYGQ